jgi:hypothetical protein
MKGFSIRVKSLNFQFFFVMEMKYRPAIAVCCADRRKLFKVFPHAAATEKHFSKCSRTLRRPKNIFQSVPARCGGISKLFKTFLHAAATEKHFSESSCTLQRLFETFQSVPARCGSISKLFELLPHAAAAV